MALRYLIVNADDFGLSAGIDQGVVTAHEQGIVTSASLMVDGGEAAGAAEYARAHPVLSVGLHVNLGEWAYRNGRWVAVSAVTPTDDASTVEREVERQLTEFRRLTHRDPTHLDSHQHVHREEPVRTVLARHANRLGVPLRAVSPGIHYFGGFYGQTAKGLPMPRAITSEHLIGILGSLRSGLTELGCHPAQDVERLQGMYKNERVKELEALCDPRVRLAIATYGIELRSFSSIMGLWAEP
jgi:predicted glycoside hydrolase/deacetylase ChbG (UPF0249 family)